MWLWAVMTWATAPDRVPLHFGLLGTVTRWGERSAWSWFGLPATATLIWAGLAYLERWVVERPDRLNLPARERILELPPRLRVRVGEAVARVVGWSGAVTLVVFTLVQWAVIRGAAGQSTQEIIMAVIAVSVLSSPLLVALLIARSNRAVDQVWRTAREEGPNGGGPGPAGPDLSR